MRQHVHNHDHDPRFQPHCCPCCEGPEDAADDAGISRRGFLGGVGGAALGGVALTGLSWTSLQAAQAELPAAPSRRPLVVKPIFAYTIPHRAHQRSWRSWGGVHTQADAEKEMARIKTELDKLQANADFPVKFLPIAPVRNAEGVTALSDVAGADVVLFYAADGGNAVYAAGKLEKDVIFFVRHKSGPCYLWYEIISPRYLRQHTDELKIEGIDFQDVVVDSQEEILWRLRSLCGLHNSLGTRILAIGGPSGWACREAPDLAREKWKLDIQTVTYPELAELIKAARADQPAVNLARRRAEAYLKLPGTKLETRREFVDNAFLLEQVFRKLMARADCRAITINGCMGTVMPISETTACVPLMTLNDEGYLAFCESDFVVIPSGILMGNITGRPPFFHNPTYPHDGVITLAHCTAPRKMDGKNLEPVRILTHYESDYGAAPKVEMRKGQKLTHVNPDFAAQRWLGLQSEIVDHPFLPICRSQIDVKLHCDGEVLIQRMPGFHWMTVYDDYLREIGYALKKIPIEFEVLS